MISKKFLKAVTLVFHFRHRKWNGQKVTLMVTLVGSVICLMSVLTGCSGHHAEDPNWDKTHIKVTSPEEATQQFGDDLLLDKLVLKTGYSKPYTEYILEHSGENSENRDTWRQLDIQIDYGGERFSVDEDHVNLYIFFKENDPDLVGPEEYPSFGLESLLSGSKTTRDINGITVTYHNFEDKEFAYAFCAEFKYLGYTYFLESYSKNNPDLSWDTINQMLNSV